MHTLKNEVSESICLLNMISLSTVESQHLTRLLRNIHDANLWDLWLQLVQLNACESLVYINCVKLNLSIPPTILSELKSTYDKIAQQNSLRNTEAKIIFAKLYDNHIPFIILKGQALAESLYGSPYYKKMNDVDFLVKKSSLDQLETIYKDQKLECAASLGGSNYRKQETFSHHWPPFFTRTMDCVLGTHWNIMTPLSPIKIDEARLWENSVPHSYLGIPCLRLNDLYFFFHLVVHLAYYKTGLKELCDPLNWYRAKKGEISSSDFLNLVHATKAFDPVYRNLCLLNRLFPDQVLQEWISALKPSVTPFVIEDTDYRCRELYYLVRSRSTQTSRIEKNYALFSLSDMFYEKGFFLFKMWKHFMWPKRKDVIFMQSLDDKVSLFQLAIAYGKTPYLLSRVFAFDLGWKLHFLLISKHHYDLVKSIFKFLASLITLGFVVPFPKTLTAKIKSLNLPVDSIEQIKTKLE
ncbi:MAG: hypothetical protein B7Y39_01070 [Bdellovibrio sp. 28-41-41]|nr:MAG: hypothetical protein B7Y39_01070 [Bdellovibrio sp. 28-41-41]